MYCYIIDWIRYLYLRTVQLQEEIDDLPPAPTLKGMQVAASFSSQDIINEGNPIEFDEVINSQSSNLGLDTTNFCIEIGEPGNYNISWWIANSGSDGPIFLQCGITKNDDTAIDDAILGCSPIYETQLSGIALITIESSDLIYTGNSIAGDVARIYLRNLSGGTIQLAPTVYRGMLNIIEVN